MLTWKHEDITEMIVHVDDVGTALCASENPHTEKERWNNLKQPEVVAHISTT